MTTVIFSTKNYGNLAWEQGFTFEEDPVIITVFFMVSVQW